MMAQIIPFPGTGRRRQSLCRRRKRCRLSLVGRDDERRKVNFTQTAVSETATQDRKDEGVCNQLLAMPTLRCTFTEVGCLYRPDASLPTCKASFSQPLEVEMPPPHSLK